MQRVTLTFDDELMSEIDRFMETRGYASRSEALRDLARAGLRHVHEDANESADCLGALVYVYDHATRELAKRLVDAQHHRHDLAVSSLHVHLDHHTCMEVAILRGPTTEVRRLGARVIAERGVRHGRLFVVPVEVARQDHAHEGDHAHPHDHVRVREAG